MLCALTLKGYWIIFFYIQRCDLSVGSDTDSLILADAMIPVNWGFSSMLMAQTKENISKQGQDTGDIRRSRDFQSLMPRHYPTPNSCPPTPPFNTTYLPSLNY